jgi:MFS family permease
MPQALGAMSIKAIIRRLLEKFGYRGVLISNTIIIGILLLLFATIGQHTPVWVILLLAYCYGGFTSIQYTSMNTLVYADVTERDTSSASSIASTMQQMSISFGVAAAGLTTAFFVPTGASRIPQEMIHGIHLAFRALGCLTIFSTIVFTTLKRGDGEAVSQQKVLRQHHPDG